MTYLIQGGGNTCDDCRWGLGIHLTMDSETPTEYLLTCNRENSSHYGHAIVIFHPACASFEPRKNDA